MIVRPVRLIRLTDDVDAVVEEMRRALAGDPELFAERARLVRVIPPNRPHISRPVVVRVTSIWLMDRLSLAARFVAPNRPRFVAPPLRYVSALVRGGPWPGVPQLEGGDER